MFCLQSMLKTDRRTSSSKGQKIFFVFIGFAHNNAIKMNHDHTFRAKFQFITGEWNSFCVHGNISY